jgi:hypothetical protein
LQRNDLTHDRECYKIKQEVHGLILRLLNLLSIQHATSCSPLNQSKSASMRLPSALPTSVQYAKSLQSWISERAAAKDAAFQIYARLYEMGLVNDNLLPLTHEWAPLDQIENLDATLTVSSQWNPMVHIAQGWTSPKLHQVDIRYSSCDNISTGVDDSCILQTILGYGYNTITNGGTSTYSQESRHRAAQKGYSPSAPRHSSRLLVTESRRFLF